MTSSTGCDEEFCDYTTYIIGVKVRSKALHLLTEIQRQAEAIEDEQASAVIFALAETVWKIIHDADKKL